LKRGEIVTVVASRDYGKPRPAVVIQSDWLNAADTLLVALLTSTLVDSPLYRLGVAPGAKNGLKAASQVMVDKIIAIPRQKCGKVIGALDESAMIALNHMLALIIGIAD
jgi:mRNA interferase MazF